ncbi:GNAT family N-acetyltransferase [Cellulomonas sp. PhB143]|uniref:GNAT family N-acetyltransferase n=1 Tax=Cellulomonas sp. PhB143 TaxID=2485186 RepID=UPI000F461CB5|nr:GNAT family N-acetyltransferase [Cellulomonas sp. PhB143]ROS72110.1 acetyltransferase (GNAT) family protein [Cellulomonas sp. PhB143]
MTTAPAWRIVLAPHPHDPGDPLAWAYAGRCAVELEAQRATWGWGDLAYRVQDVIEKLSHQEYVRRVLLVALAPAADEAPVAEDPVADIPVADDVLGYASLELPLTANTHLAELDLAVRPGHEGRGIGGALLDAAERVARDAGRGTVVASAEHAPEPPAGPAALAATTGSGRVPRDARATRLATSRGYALEQVERYSVLRLPVDVDAVARLAADARARAGTAYRILTWTDAVPAGRLPALAGLQTRMSTDAPSGDLDVGEDPWDADRYAERLAAWRRRGLGFTIAAAEHVASRELVAFTVLTYPLADPGFAFQEDTLVLTEHRGRRLGTLVKTANLTALGAVRPATERVHTWNAEENGPMLDINVALGFRPVGVEALWQRSLSG